MDPSKFESLRNRLAVCKEQYKSKSSLNTKARKSALLSEIEFIEGQLADALGLEEYDSDNEGIAALGQAKVKVEKETPTTATPSAPLPPSLPRSNSSITMARLSELSVSSSPSTPSPRARSPPLDYSGPTASSKRLRLESKASEPFVKSELISSHEYGATSALNSSSSHSSSVGGSRSEQDSIKSALLDAGDDIDDIDELLRAQQQLEYELAEKRRRREEEDERLARMLQEEEYQTATGTSFTIPGTSSTTPGTSSTAPSTSSAFPRTSSTTSIALSAEPSRAFQAASSASTSQQPLMSSVDKARQERADYEMAKLFEESEARSFNLSTMKSGQASAHTSPRAPLPQMSSASFSSSPFAASSFSPSTNMSPTTTMNSSFSSRLAQQQQYALALARQLTQTSASPTAKANPNTPVFPIFGNQSSTPGASASTTAPNPYANYPPSIAKRMADADKLKKDEAELRVVLGALERASKAAEESREKATRVDLTRSTVVVPSDSDDDGADSDSDSYWKSYGSGPYGWHLDSDDGEHYSDYDLFGYLYDNSSRYGSSSRYVSSAYQKMKTYTESDIQKELQDLLSNIKEMEEIPPEDRLGTPEGMARNMVLLEHQKIGLTWLQKMEDSRNKGGILADDMGLGKTVQSIALMVSRRGEPPKELKVWDNSRVYYAPPPPATLIKTKATLIVAPTALVYQWENEINAKTTPGLLNVYVHYLRRKSDNLQEIARSDVIITSYGSVAAEMGYTDVTGRKDRRAIGPLFKLQFHRIILDEAHLIKNRTTKAAIACTALQATYRWCLTGTPFQNKITELFSLIQFLRIRPYDEYTKFARDISNPIQRLKTDQAAETERVSAMHRLQALMKAICLRRSKKDQVDGKPILSLPPRHVNMTNVTFSPDEAAFYHALETRTVDRFNAYVKAGTVMKNYTNVLLLLLRLRQACCHPHLIKDFLKADDADADQGGSTKAKLDKLLDKLSQTIINRLLKDVDLDSPECPICMDVGEQSVLLSKCGHIYCKTCIATHLERHEPEDRKCPECRGLTKLEEIIPVKEFVHRYRPAPPPALEEDPKGKGKAVEWGEGGNDDLPEVPAAMDAWMSSAKIDKMVEIVNQVIAKREKVIVFSQFTTLLTLIERPLADSNIPYLRYDGTINPDQRNKIIQDFMDPTKDYPVILISLKCGSLGLNLVAANHVIMMDPWWNPAIENQAIDRAHRIGQTRSVHVYRLAVPNSVEDRIYRLQQDKQALIDGALGESETIPKLARLNLQDLIYLFRGTRN